MVRDESLANRADSIRKVLSHLTESLNIPLRSIKIGLEKTYFGLYRKGISALDHSAGKCLKKDKK